jgi:predicted transcriptional regulator YdeE
MRAALFPFSDSNLKVSWLISIKLASSGTAAGPLPYPVRMKILSFACVLAVGLSSGVVLHQQAAAPAASTAPVVPATAAIKVEDQAAFSMIGISVQTTAAKEAGGDGEIAQLWQKALGQGQLEDIPSRAGGGLIAVYSNFAKTDTTTSYTYTLGYKVSSTAKVPDGFMAIDISAGKYAIVPSDQGALPDILPKLWKGIFAMSPAQLGGERAFKADYEEYPEGMNWQDTQVNAHLGLK